MRCATCGKWLSPTWGPDDISKYQPGDTYYCYKCGKIKEEEEERVRWQNDGRWARTRFEELLEKYPDLRDIKPGEVGVYRDNIQQLEKAKNLELAARYEDSAQEYENLRLWNHAGRVRRMAGIQTVKHISVDLNALIERLSQRGLAIPYKCHSCGGTITIDKNSRAEGLKFCSYCGTAFNTNALEGLLNAALK